MLWDSRGSINIIAVIPVSQSVSLSCGTEFIQCTFLILLYCCFVFFFTELLCCVVLFCFCFFFLSGSYFLFFFFLSPAFLMVAISDCIKYYMQYNSFFPSRKEIEHFRFVHFCFVGNKNEKENSEIFNLVLWN